MLRSIYEGDDCFKEIGPTTFQYKVSEDEYFYFIEVACYTDFVKKFLIVYTSDLNI